MQRVTSRPGQPYPLGATWDGEGVNFALFSENATSVDLCLFDRPDSKGTHRIRMEERTNQVWHVSYRKSARATITAIASTDLMIPRPDTVSIPPSC